MARLIPNLVNKVQSKAKTLGAAASKGSKLASKVREAANQAGNALPPDLQHRLETSLHENLSDVRVFQDHRATLASATAFTQGTDIFFAPGQYNPHTNAGYELLAHELTHVVQQGGGHNKVKIPEGMSEVLDEADLSL